MVIGRRTRTVTVTACGIAALLVAAPVAAHSTSVQGSAASSKCSISWAKPVSGSYSKASNWTPRRVPTASDNVCITKAGKKSYTVTMTNTLGGFDVKSLSIGAMSGKTRQSLTMLAPSEGIGIRNTGPIVINSRGGFESDAAQNQAVLFGPGRIINYGLLTYEGAFGQHNIFAPITNEKSGTIVVSGAKNTCCTNLFASVSNLGSVSVLSGGHLRVQGGTFSQSGGTLSNHGIFEVNAHFAQLGGHGSGTPVALNDNSTLRDTGGTGALAARGMVTFTGNVMTGQTVSIVGYGGDSTLVTTSNFSNFGTLVLTNDPTIGGTPHLLGIDGSGEAYTLTNHGTFEDLIGSGAYRFINVNVVNDATTDVTAPVTYVAAGTTFTNNGILDVGAGDQLVFGGSTVGQSNFTQTAQGKLVMTPATGNVAPIFQPPCGAHACLGQSLTAGGTLEVKGTRPASDFPVMTRPNDDNGDNYPLPGAFAKVSAGYAVAYNSPLGTDALSVLP